MSAEEIESKLGQLDFSDLEIDSDTDSDSGDDNEQSTLSQASKPLASKPLEKEDIVTKYADKIKTEPFKKGPQVTKDRSKRATVEQVLDARTLRFLGKIFRSGLITRINGCISTGKEANIYHGTHDDEGVTEEFAVKIYKTSILVFKDRKRYVDGEFRFRNTKDQGNPRKMVKIWAEKEFRNLNRIYQSNVPCPRPYVIKSHVLVMQYLTEGDDQPSPKLKDYSFKNIEDIIKYYREMLICMRRLFQNCRLVHADLSEYNSIVHKDKLYIIDVSQSVEPDHPMALDFLRMDIKNVNDYFARQNIDIYPEKAIFTFVTEPLGIEDIEQALNSYLDSTPLKTTKDQEIEDEIFRSLHLVRSLKHLDERDFQKFSEGGVDTMRELVAPALPSEETTAANGDDYDEAQDEETNETETETDKGSEEDYSDDDEDEDEDLLDEDEHNKPKGKKYEDKDEKKARKEAVKLAKQEKRKTKMKKHVKKKLINKRKGETKCFFEELQRDTLVVGKIDAYEKDDHSNEYSKNGKLRVQITIVETFDNNHQVIDQKSSPNGEFTFTSLDSGEHKFCLTPVYSDNTHNKLHRIFFDVVQGSTHDYVDSKSTKLVDELTKRVNTLYEKLDKIHWEQETMREREALFRDQSESTNSRVVKWSIVQLFVLIGTCVYQLRHLKSFFVKQKIV